MAAPRHDSAALADLAPTSPVLTSDATQQEVIFTVPPAAVMARVRLNIAARPLSFEPQPGLEVSLNGGPAVALDPLPQAFSAQFDFSPEDIIEGRNRLTVRLAGPAPTKQTGWELDWDNSRLDLLFMAPGPQDRATFEKWMAADFGPPRSVSFAAPALPEAAQADLQSRFAIALGRRSGGPLRFVGPQDAADLAAAVVIDPRLSKARLTHSGGEAARLTLSAPDLAAARAALHDFAADAPARAPHIPPARHVRNDLAAVARGELGRPGYSLALPERRDDRAAALSLVARLAREQAAPMMPGWVGFDPLEAPASADLAVIADGAALPPALLTNAPRALEAALRAAEPKPIYKRFRIGAQASAAMPDGGAAARFPSASNSAAWTTIITSARGVTLHQALSELIEADSLDRFSGRVMHWRNGVVQVQDRGAWRAPGAAALKPRTGELARTLNFLTVLGGLISILLLGVSIRRRKFGRLIHGV